MCGRTDCSSQFKLLIGAANDTSRLVARSCAHRSGDRRRLHRPDVRLAKGDSGSTDTCCEAGCGCQLVLERSTFALRARRTSSQGKRKRGDRRQRFANARHASHSRLLADFMMLSGVTSDGAACLIRAGRSRWYRTVFAPRRLRSARVARRRGRLSAGPRAPIGLIGFEIVVFLSGRSRGHSMGRGIPNSPWWKSRRSMETGEAPRSPGATTENIGPYSMEEQRRERGCIAGRMPPRLPPRAAKAAYEAPCRRRVA